MGPTGNGRNPKFNGRRQPSIDGTSRMMREYQVRICERLGVKFLGPTRQSRRLTLRRLLPVFPGKQTFSAATPAGCKRFERGAGAVYKKRAGVFSRHHDDTTMRDENQA